MVLDNIRELLKNKTQEQLIVESTKTITDLINQNQAISYSDLIVGKLYFIFYDIAGKNTKSKMERYNPCLLVQIDKQLIILNINFIPMNIKLMLFDSIFIDKNVPLITFNSIYSALNSIGYEYTLRVLNPIAINKIIEIDNEYLIDFLLCSTTQFTGVPDSKLIEIWKSKIQNQEETKRKLIQELSKDLITIQQEINKYISNVHI